jgi:2-C-methyl-D-erythritol 4-phosphate cytidylyltransferase
MTTAALVLAAGRGERLAAGVPKAFCPLGGEPLLLRALRALAGATGVEHLIPVVAAGDRERYEALAIDAIPGLTKMVEGGAERMDSVAAGVAALPAGVRFVAVHDAARCLVSPADVEAVLEAGRRTGAAILAERVRDTVKRVDSCGQIVTLPREELWAAQTPQVFAVEWLREGLAKARSEGRQATDDAQLLEALGRRVEIVESRRPNPKITRPQDLAWAENWLAGEGG